MSEKRGKKKERPMASLELLSQQAAEAEAEKLSRRRKLMKERNLGKGEGGEVEDMDETEQEQRDQKDQEQEQDKSGGEEGTEEKEDEKKLESTEDAENPKTSETTPPSPEDREKDHQEEGAEQDDQLRFSPPSPRTAQLSAEMGRKGVGVLKYLDLHQLIVSHLEPNVRGERDFKTLCNEAKRRDSSAEMGRLLKNLRQEVKKLYGERRKRKQLLAWDQLEQVVGIKSNQSAKQGDTGESKEGDEEKKGKTPVDEESVLGRAFAVEQLVSKWFMDRTLFDEHFIRELSVYLVGLLARGEKSPGSVLSMPRVVIDKIVYLHIMRSKDRFHELHRVFFSDLFTPADIEMAVLSACNCEQCIEDWGVNKIEMRSLDSHVRFHWTQEKAQQAAFLLRAHLKYGNDVASALAGRNIPKMRTWSETDFKTVLRNIHTCASCFLCQMNRGKRPMGKIEQMQVPPPPSYSASPSTNTSSTSSSSTGEEKIPTSLPVSIASLISGKPRHKFKRLKDTPQTRPIGPQAKRKIREALMEQNSKFAKSSSSSSLSLARANWSGSSEEGPPEINQNTIELCLTSQDYLRAFLEKGVLQPLGVSVDDTKGVVKVDVKEDLEEASISFKPYLPPQRLVSLTPKKVRVLTTLILKYPVVKAKVEQIIRETRELLQNEEERGAVTEARDVEDKLVSV